MTQAVHDQRRVQFDFDIEFLNGGGIHGQGFRLDIEGEDIDEPALADYIVRDLRLLMVGRVRILNKTILTEPHKRSAATTAALAGPATLIELSHTVEDGMVTYKGLPAPIICDHLSRVQSRDLVHTALLGAGIPIVEHLCRLDQVPNGPFRFCAAPVKVKGMGTFPVRAYARMQPP